MLDIKEVFMKHAADGLYFGDSMPGKKLRNAIGAMPVEGDVLALLDCTVFGSCKNGLAITNKGLYWSNDWTVDSSVFGLSWEEFSSVSRPPIYKSYSIVIRPGVNIGVSGCPMNKKKLLEFFKDLHGFSVLMVQEKNKGELQGCTPGKVDGNSRSELPSNGETCVLSESGDVQNVYDDATAYILALVTVADGAVNDDEVNFAHEFIYEEDSVLDKDGAVKKYNESVRTLFEAKSKSTAIFKIKANKMLSMVVEIEDDDFFYRISLMLEGMVEAAGGVKNRETVDMVHMVLGKNLFSSDINKNIHCSVKTVNEDDPVAEVEEKIMPSSSSVVDDLNFLISDSDGSENSVGVNKYWPRVERFVVNKMLDVADEKLNSPEELVLYFSKIHGLLPVAVRLLLSQDKFIDILMSKREVILDRVRLYKGGRERESRYEKEYKARVNMSGGEKSVPLHEGGVEKNGLHVLGILADAIERFELALMSEEEDEEGEETTRFMISPIKFTYRVVVESIIKEDIWSGEELNDEDIIVICAMLIGCLYANAIIGLPRGFKDGMGDTWFSFLAFPLVVMDFVREVCHERSLRFDLDEDDAMMLQVFTSDFSSDEGSRDYMNRFLSNAGVSTPFELVILFFGQVGVSERLIRQLMGEVQTKVCEWFQEALAKV